MGMRVDIFGANEGAKPIAGNPSSSASQSKHTDVKIHFIQGVIRAGKVRVMRVGT